MNNFILQLIAGLNKSKSMEQIKSDAKNLGDIKIPLVGTLNKAKTRAQIKQDLASMNGTINLTGKFNQKGVVTSVQQATQQAQKTVSRNPIQVSMSVKKDKLINDIKIFGQQNTKLFKDANMSAKYNSLLDNAKLATSGKELQNLRLQLSAMRSEVKATNLSGLTLGDTFKKTFKRAIELFTGTAGVMALSHQLREAWTQALELDKAYTDLIKVQSELTRGDYSEYLDQCNRKAQELATTQKSLIEGATEFSKSGYTKTQSDKLAEKSTVLSNVGDMSASDSAKAIISGVQAYDVVDGYDDVIDKAGALIDKYNEIGNTASITTEEIAQGVQTVGSVFSDANTSVDQFIALLSAGNRQFQNADTLALGLRTAALRIRGCDAQLQQLGETTDGVYTSASKLAAKIEGLTNVDGKGGVQILEADGETFRSIYDIFVDISKVYQKMSDTDQSALLDLIAGKNRASAVSATLNNMTEAQEIYERSLNSAGSAQKEYDTYLESSEAGLNRFKSTMTETYQSVISGQTVTALLNCGNATLQFVNNLGLVESTLKGLVAIGIVKAITTLSTAFKASAISASNFGTALNTVKNMSSMAKGTAEYKNALQALKTVSAGLSETQLKQVLASTALSNSDKIAILRTTGLTQAQAQAKLTQMGLTQSTQAQTTANASATASTFSLTAAVKGFGASLKAAFMSNPVGITIMAISTAVGVISSAVSTANQKADEARQKAKDAADTASTLSNEISELTGKYLSLSEAIKTDSSSKEELMTVQDELIKKLGAEGENVDSLISKYGSLDEAIKNLTLQELGEKENDLLAGVKAAEDELKDIGAGYEHWYSITDRNLLSSGGDDAVKAYDVLNKAGIISDGSYGTGGGALVLTGDDSTIEGILENYQKLQEAMTTLRESDQFTEEELKNNPVFNQIYNRSQEMKEFVDGYNDAITDLNKNVAQQQTLIALKGTELPDTEEEFNAFRDNLIKTAQDSDEFIGSQEDIENAINSYLSTVPQFSSYYGDLSSAVENTTENIKQLQETTQKDTQDPTAKRIAKATKRVQKALKDYTEAQAAYYAEGNAAKKAGANTSKTKYGNINLNEDRKLKWNSLNLDRYGDNIASWYDESAKKKYKTVDDFVNSYLGTVSTVDARSEEFDGVEIAFTPMMKTKDGMEYLDSDTVHTYINSLISEAQKDDGKWTDEELFALDAEGLTVDGKKVKNLIADIGATATKTGETMHYLGADGSMSMAADDAKKASDKLDAANAKLEKIKSNAFTKVWNNAGSGSSEADQAIAKEKENLLELAKAGRLTEDTFEKSSVADKFTDIGMSIKDATTYLNKFVTKSDQLNGMEAGIKSISEVLGQKKENLKNKKTKDQGISPDVLAGFDENVKGLDSWKEFEKTMGNGKSTMEECQKAANKLATEWVNDNNFLAQLNDTNKDYYISSLDNMGVANAEAVVTQILSNKHKVLSAQKLYAKETGEDLTDQSVEEINRFAEEKGYTAQLRAELYNLALQKQLTNGSKLSFDDDLDAITDLVESAGVAVSALNALSSSKYAFEQGKSGGLPQDVVHAQLAMAQKEVDAAKKKLNDKANSKVKPKVKPKITDTSSSSGKGSKSGSDKSSSSKQTIDWIERALNRVSSTLDLIKAKAENLFGTNSLKTLQKQEASLKSQYNILKKQYDYQNKAEKKYLAKANSVKLSSSLKKAVQNGRISGSLKQLIATYGEKTATRIQNYQDYWDKAQDQKKSKEETRKAMRENISDRYQLHIDDADARKSRNEADLENLTTAKSKEKVLKDTLKHIATSYDYQIKQAKLENNDVKVTELKAQKKKEQRETEVQILQNYADEYEATVGLYEAQSSSTTNLTKKNSLLSKSIPVLKNQYDKLIAIAKKEGNITEQKRLQNEYQDKLNEKLKAQFDNVVAEYEYQQTGYQQRTDSINNAVSLSEAKGHYAGKAFYQNLQNSQKDSLKSLEAERDSIIKQRQEAIANGLKLDSEQYREMTKQIWTADRNIEQMNTDIANTAKQIREAKYALDEFTQTRIDERNNEAEFYKTIMGYKDSFDKNGNITGEGLGTLTSDVFEIQNNMAKVEEYKKSLADLDAQYKRGDMGYEEFITKNQSLTESMRDAESQVYSLKDAIKSLIEDGLNKQLDALNELIEKYKKTLDSAKDLREYNKNIAEQTKNITTIQKQLAALNGDTSEEGRARIQKLQVSLKDAKEQLEDTEYDKRMSDIENILTDLTDDFQDFIDDQMDHIDGLVDKIITAITVNSGVSGEKIIELAKQLGFTLSDSLLNFIKNGNNTTDKDANAETDKKSQEDSKDAIKQVTDFAKQQLKENNSVAEGTAQANHKKAEEAKKNSGSSTKGSYNFINGGIATKINQCDGKVSYNDIGKKGTLKKGATYYDYALAGGVKKGDKGHTTKAAHAVTIAAIDQNGNAKLKSATKALNGVWIPKSKLKYLQGFSQGGRVGDLQNIVRMNGDDGVTINTLKKGEEVLTPYNADLFDQFVDFLPDLVDYNNNLVDMLRPTNVPATKVRTGDLTLNIDNIELPNVTDPKEFSAGLIAAMQQDKKLQRFWGDATAGSLNNNMSGIYKY